MTGIRGAHTAARSIRRPLRGAHWRVLQGLQLVASPADPAVDARLRALLGDERQWALLARLTPFDRAHHLRVHELLVAGGVDDPDVLLAALLHDVGKADARGRAHLGHRAINVLLRPIGPRALDRLARGDIGPLHGLYLARFHAALGARLAEAAGVSPRCRDLIARHDDHGVVADADLAALIAADEAAIR